MTWLLLLPLAWLSAVALLLLAWRRPLLALWREPVFKAPVLIVESDDWGAGPASQAAALDRIAAVLARHRDQRGRPARMTLALVLAAPEPRLAGYRTLADGSFRPVLEAIHAGINAGVFAPQLHGMTHFWPDSLLAAASRPEVAAWLDRPGVSESLPSALQSRWVDASVLPSRPHPREEVERAAAAEVALYASLFGSPPQVVVPPTFVWNETVEAAWARAGVALVITPGRRLTGRDAAGAPAFADRSMRNGEAGAGGVRYLVRDEYFEPRDGQRPEQALAALARKTARGRPCLLETHRWNFLAETGGDLDSALAALDELHGRALAAYPGLRFSDPAELLRALRAGDPDWIERSVRGRFTIWLVRAAELPRFGRLARLFGLFLPFNLPRPS